MVAQTLSPGVKKRRVDRRARREARAFYLFISPWIIGFLVFSLGPIIAAFYFSLTNLHALNIHDGLPQFIGLKNYTNMLADNIFRYTLVATGIWTFGGLAVNTIVGILLAQLLNQRIPGLRFFRTIFYMPTVIAGVAAGYIWLFILRTNDGLLNGVLGALHIQGPDWLGSTTTAPLTLLMYNAWYVGQTMIIYLAAVQGVPTPLYEAASIDGAGPIRRFFNVTLPMISPVILFNLVIGLINQLQAFIPAFVITNGGPHYSTYLIGYAIYQLAFNFGQGGYAAAWAISLFVISLILTVVLFSVSRRFVHYQEGR